MRGRLLRRLIFGMLLIFQLSICVATESPDPNNSSRYLNAVRTFADNYTHMRLIEGKKE